jgi:tRNA A-37 threonylcarbamoyl transferase component Bud32
MDFMDTKSDSTEQRVSTAPADKLVEPQTASPGVLSKVHDSNQSLALPTGHEHIKESIAVGQTARVAASENELAKYLPDIWQLYMLPLFFSVSIFTVNLLFLCRHIGTDIFTPEALNASLLNLFLFAVYFASSACDGKLKRAPAQLFNTADATTDAALFRAKNANLGLLSTLQSCVRPAKSGFFAGIFKNVFSLALLGVAMLTVPFCLLGVAGTFAAQHAAWGYFYMFAVSAFLSFAVFRFAKRRDGNKKSIRDAYLYASSEPSLSVLLKRDLTSTKASETVIDYDAFADIQRWFKHRFSQRSWKKTAFVILLVFGFVCFDGLSLLLHSITLITGLLTKSAVLTPGTAGGVGGTAVIGGGLHLFSNLITLLCLSGFVAYLYATHQPTHLRLSADGIEFLYNRKQFGSKNIKRIAWKEIREMRVVTIQGKTLVGDKELCFEGDKGALLKFKLNCIESISNREQILQSIEKWAPTLKRDADVIQILQRPPEQSYTDLWLQTLASPPKRDRLKPLVTQSVLQDGRYTIVRELGLGGQGTAYLALDGRTEKTVVLKEFILPIYVDISVRKSALERFENEARILQKLNHDQIVKLTDFFVEDHRGYLALDYIQGADLKKFVERNGKLSEDAIIPLVYQMCEILQYLHTQDPPVIHRDFTPDNLILQPDGRLMLIDFNVAQQTSATVTGTIVGKQCYLPPEQFQGDPVIQSDIYSMGATVYFLCTGKDPEPISQSHPQRSESSISQALDLFVSNCTTIDPDLRYKNAAECASSLSGMLNRTELD